MGKETSTRIQTSILNAAEKKVLVWLAQRQPKWVTSDMLTYIGVLGSIICAVGFALAHLNLNYLWLASFGLFVNWYGDSLDGTIARVRDTQRPLYGFFIDHSLDGVTICIMCIGAGLSPMFRLDIALFVLAGYLLISTYTYICTILKDEFRLTYGLFGPTEFRLAAILMNIVYTYSALGEIQFTVYNQTLGIFDILALLIAVIIYGSHFTQFVKDRKYFEKLDPIKPLKK